MGMKRKKLANIVMAAAVLVIVIAGVLTVGAIQGWFDDKEADAAVLTDIRGIVYMERGGAAYSAEDQTVLRAGDRISCETDAQAKISAGGCVLTLGGETSVEITDPSAEGFSVQVTGGEVFADVQSPMSIAFGGEQLALTDAVAWFRADGDTQHAAVFSGAAGTVKAGQMCSFAGGTQAVETLLPEMLDAFAAEQLCLVDSARGLCFTADELEQLRAANQPAVQTGPADEPETSGSESEAPAESAAVSEAPEASAEEDQTKEETVSATAKPSAKPSAGAKPTAKASATPKPTAKPTATPKPAKTCTVSIRCDTVLNNWDKLDPAKTGCVPSSGWILSATVTFEDGETVFDVLKRACSNYGISLEYSWSPMYGDYYIEGINGLYEFDCGSQSGWMYNVNGWYPNYGCSGYTLSNGDSVEWRYTCSNGSDIGG
ncbi:MAG: DUF4430 domain-containing protein [Hominenteromicrobium sp.]